MIESSEACGGKRPGKGQEGEVGRTWYWGKKENMNTWRKATEGDCRIGILIFMCVSLLSNVSSFPLLHYVSGLNLIVVKCRTCRIHCIKL